MKEGEGKRMKEGEGGRGRVKEGEGKRMKEGEGGRGRVKEGEGRRGKRMKKVERVMLILIVITAQRNRFCCTHIFPVLAVGMETSLATISTEGGTWGTWSGPSLVLIISLCACLLVVLVDGGHRIIKALSIR